MTIDRDLLGPNATYPPTSAGRVSEDTAAELLAVLRAQLPARLGGANRPVSLEGHHSSYSCTSPLAVLLVTLEDGTCLPVVWKDLSPHSAMPSRTAKPLFLRDPRRELLAYDTLLDLAAPGTARCYAVHDDAEHDVHWLFLERVAGVRLPEAADPNAWVAAAQWLARTHAALGQRVATAGVPDWTVRHDATHLWRWMDRAVESAAGGHGEDQVRRVADRYGAVVDRITRLPATVIHGELYPTNVLVVESGGVVSRICPVDWETVGIGPALLDLAALTSGNWEDEERSRIVAAYLETSAGCVPEPDELAAALETLDYCRLYLCVQWLGWSDSWSAPADQAHDWLAESAELSDRLFRESASLAVGE